MWFLPVSWVVVVVGLAGVMCVIPPCMEYSDGTCIFCRRVSGDDVRRGLGSGPGHGPKLMYHLTPSQSHISGSFHQSPRRGCKDSSSSG